LVDIWEQEKAKYVSGTFPNVSSDRNWQSVGNYTQMIWRKTTQVGCGIANSGNGNYLVCWYSPRGNTAGQAVY
jgi:hypothetical protein